MLGDHDDIPNPKSFTSILQHWKCALFAQASWRYARWTRSTYGVRNSFKAPSRTRNVRNLNCCYRCYRAVAVLYLHGSGPIVSETKILRAPYAFRKFQWTRPYYILLLLLLLLLCVVRIRFNARFLIMHEIKQTNNMHFFNGEKIKK